MATLVLFAAARQVAGTGTDVVPGATVAEVLASASERYGEAFAAVLGNSRVWVNGVPAAPETVVTDGDEVAILPPVSGGSS
jgi:sulfur-carrier protein